MAIIEHDRVWETATVTGTGSITLAGTPAATGARTFASVYANGDQCPYSIIDGTTGASETGIGTLAISGGVATLARAVVIESTNGNAAVAFAGNSCSVLVSKLPGVQTSAGAADAGKVPILGGAGEFDWSMHPDDFQTPSGGITPGTPLGYTNALDAFNTGNYVESVGGLGGWENYWLFRWRGPRKIASSSMVVTTAGSATYSLSIMSIGASQLSLFQTITVGGFSDAATGVQTISGLSFDWPQGDYVLQMVKASGSGGQLLNGSTRESAHGPNFGWAAYRGGYAPARGFLNNAGASTLASTFSGTPGGGFQDLKMFPKIWFNGTN
jgi:hypothetical protein